MTNLRCHVTRLVLSERLGLAVELHWHTGRDQQSSRFPIRLRSAVLLTPDGAIRIAPRWMLSAL